MSKPFGVLLARDPPSRAVGTLTALVLVGLCTLIVYPLAHVVAVLSLSVVYLPAVLVVSIAWGAWMGIATGVLSAAAFNFFHLPPIGTFTLGHSSDWVALAAFLVVATLSSSVGELTRARAHDAEDRRREADLAAEMARLLLRGSLAEALPTAAARLAQALELHSAAIEMDAVEGEQRTVAFPLREGERQVGTLLVGADAPEQSLRRLRERVVPALEALVSAALERERLLGGVVETAALRRADSVKTALLRAVSHDLRSPLTAISAAGEAIATASLSPEELREMAAVVEEEAMRLSRLVDNLLDLSRLEAGAAEPRRDWTSLEELLGAAILGLGWRSQDFTLSIDRELPLISIDAVQMERAFVNVLENARRHSGGHPVSVRARAVRALGPHRGAAPSAAGVGEAPSAAGGEGPSAAGGEAPRRGGDRVIVRVVDRGPGIAPGQLERVFEPFYREAGASGGAHQGSGLGLAIARGFTEANSGTLHVESLPGQGAAFVFELPLQGPAANGAEPPQAGRERTSRPPLLAAHATADAPSGVPRMSPA